MSAARSSFRIHIRFEAAIVGYAAPPVDDRLANIDLIIIPSLLDSGLIVKDKQSVLCATPLKLLLTQSHITCSWLVSHFPGES